LIIEDNPDVVIYLKSCLDEFYEIDVALNGEIGVEKAIQHIPDLIISDLMMPGKDGFEVCAELKQDIRTSHIPIILLTAKATKPARISGLRHGADAYLIKPFDKEELLVRLEMLIKKQQSIIQYLSSRHAQSFNSEHPAAGDSILKEEEAFIQKVTSIVAENFGDEDFVLPQLCQKVGMSRSQLFRKMKALMGTSPSEFIRSYRLSHAKKLLETGNITVSEAAWQVGYKDLAHFSKSYQEKFGFPPSTTHK
jgi:DNA-binding response OmpR family regulator